jgi:biopolymer transport protein ExbD
MKLESNLPERPGLLHATPIFDIFALLLLFFLLGPSFVLQSGIRVDPPPSRFQLERFGETLAVNLVTGTVDGTPTIYLGREPLAVSELATRLRELHREGAAQQAVVLLKSDQNTPIKVEREIAEIIVAAGFRLALVGRLPDESTPPEPLRTEDE